MIIKNGRVFNEKGYFEEKNLYLKGEKIVECAEGEIIDATDLYVIPGLVDLHFHGAVGYDFCDGTTEAIRKIAEYELQNGICAICPASMTFSEEKLTEIFQVAAQYKKTESAEKTVQMADLVGINMEGPFISMDKKGAQNGAYIHLPDVNMFERLQTAASGLIRLVDIAPEVSGAMECIQELSRQVRVSVAHTAADYEIAKQSFQKGAKQVTHLYNGMNVFSHREPGVMGAAYDNKDVAIELICDGVHSHPATVRLTFDLFSDNRVIMISDSMMACGLEDGQYTLGGQDVTVRSNRATLTEAGNIAGSVTNLMGCIRTAVKDMDIPLESAVKCATINPAKAIGIDDSYGSLAIGKKANVVLLNQDLSIYGIIKDGELVS